MKNTNNLSSLTKDQRVGLRNFFVQRAVLSLTVSNLVPALSGLKIIGSEIPAVRLSHDSNRSVAVSDSTKSVKFDIVDSFGQAFKGIKTVKVLLVNVSDNKAELKDITAAVKLNQDKSGATWTIGTLPIGRYQLILTIDSFPVTSPTIVVTD